MLRGDLDQMFETAKATCRKHYPDATHCVGLWNLAEAIRKIAYSHGRR
jgi:hypothetical protein